MNKSLKQSDPGYWREYYASHREKLREYNRERMRKKRGFVIKKSDVDKATEYTVTTGPIPLDMKSEPVEKEEIIRHEKRQAEISALRSILNESLNDPNKFAPTCNLGKPCKLCGSKLTTEVFYEDPDWSGNVWLCEKHRKDKGL